MTIVRRRIDGQRTLDSSIYYETAAEAIEAAMIFIPDVWPAEDKSYAIEQMHCKGFEFAPGMYVDIFESRKR